MVATVSRTFSAIAFLTICAGLSASLAAHASPTCPEEHASAQVPKDLGLCKRLLPNVKNSGGMRLDEYEKKLNQFFVNLCHRDLEHGWHVDKRVRDTGPWTGTYANGKWTGEYRGTHAPVMVWYSPDFYDWLKTNRPQHGPVTAKERPVPDGAIMVKEMYSAPAAACAGIDPLKLLPGVSGAAIMVRDSRVAQDGWFWGWYGWPGFGWAPDWPASSGSSYPLMGFGQYCTNCHASAKDNQTFAALNNIKGEPGQPLVFLSQNFFLDPSWQSQQVRMAQAAAAAPAMAARSYDPDFLKLFPWHGGPPPTTPVVNMPPATYDNVWVKAGPLSPASQYITSDQCIGCHDAGGTGLQFDMTQPGTDDKLLNISPYGSWRGSPMGLAGRDPIFFAQLASETEAFHSGKSLFVQDTCLGCHGILGQRQNAIDSFAKNGKCQPFLRTTLNAVPDSADKSVVALARYGSLGRDGISCAACHHMVLGDKDSAKYKDDPQNKCVQQRQDALNPGLKGFAKTATGSFLVGPPDKVFGPFQEPKLKPMKNALGIEPAHSRNVLSSELCGSCHTVHLPVLFGDKTIGHVYEQTTYPEWAFSDYRTGDSPDGALPYGAGPQAQSCQDCHMPNKDTSGNPYRSKIASIQEYSNFPQAENTLPPKDIDLKERVGFGKHTLVCLNVFLLEMASQFPDVMGILLADPMLTKKGIDSIPAAKAAMVDQALNKTATVTIGDIGIANGILNAQVSVINRVGHKFPSGVGFRRAFVEFDVLDVDNKVLWSSGRTNSSGVIVDDKGVPIAGELWWKDDCSARIDPDARIHQPHYREITRQDQAQIYQELVSTPPNASAKCGPNEPPQGQLTTSFLSICSKVKDNRLLPHGFLSLAKRMEIARALGASGDMAEESGATGVGDDPDYVTGGGDQLVYRVPLAALTGNAKPAAVQATLYYQATPPYFLQDRFCTSKSADTQRLYYVAGNLSLAGTPAQDWKLRVVTSGPVTLP